MDTYHTAKILEAIIASSFQGRQSALAQATGLAPSQLSRTISGLQPASVGMVKTILSSINQDDADQLIGAFVRDIAPADLHEKIIDAAGHIKNPPPAPIPPEIRFLRWLENASKTDPDVRDWLRSTGKLWGVLDDQNLRVADEPGEYSTPTEKSPQGPSDD